MSSIRIRAMERLGDLIACEVKELKGKICAGPASREHRLAYPSLAINPLRFRFLPDQPTFRDPVTGECYEEPLAKQAVVNKGRWEGTVEFRLGAKTAAKRYELEHKIEQMFLKGATSFLPGREDLAEVCSRPGVILIDVPECHGARLAFELEDGAWDNEKVFSKQWYSVLRVTAQIPALVVRSPVYTIDELRLTSELETVSGNTDSETITIATDGSITGV